MTDLPELLSAYIQSCIYAEKFNETGKLDLSNTEFILPTTILPLSNLIISNHDKYIPPSNYSVANYISTILSGSGSTTYVPINQLVTDEKTQDESLQSIFKLQGSDPNLFGGESFFKLIIGELVDNIFQHSECTSAKIAAQKYKQNGYADFCIFDDGVTIPAKLANHGFQFDNPARSIAAAINGTSTKDDDRGFGLQTSVKLSVDGLNGEVLVVSGAGAVHFVSGNSTMYNLGERFRLNGTLISLRLPLVSEKKSWHDYMK